MDWNKSIGSEVEFQYGDICGTIKINDYKDKYLYIEYGQVTYKILNGNFIKCKIGKMLAIITNEYRYNLGDQVITDKDNLTIIDRRSIKKIRKNGKYEYIKSYKYKCNKCGYDEGWIREGNLVHGNGCACCCPNPQVVIQGINDIPTTEPWMVKYFQGGIEEAKRYTKGSKKSIYFQCPICKKVKDKKMLISTLFSSNSIFCSCEDGASFAERVMRSILIIKNIPFTTEIQFDWCKFYNIFSNKYVFGRYDFVIDSKNIIIEMDGAFHYLNKSYVWSEYGRIKIY